MPVEAASGHPFRADIFKMLKDMQPAFVRFPGYVTTFFLYLLNQDPQSEQYELLGILVVGLDTLCRPGISTSVCVWCTRRET